MADRRSSVRFPGESDAYRAARDDLLRDEIALRRQTEAVAAKRRALPLGGLVPEDYEFAAVVTTAGAGATHAMRLSELFRRGRNTLVVYSFMFGPQMKRPCPSCTSILDALDGEAPHIMQRVNLAVVAKSSRSGRSGTCSTTRRTVAGRRGIRVSSTSPGETLRAGVGARRPHSSTSALQGIETSG